MERSARSAINLWELLFTPRLHFRHAIVLFVEAVLYKRLQTTHIFVTHLLAGLILGLGRSGHSQFFLLVQGDSEVFEWFPFVLSEKTDALNATSQFLDKDMCFVAIHARSSILAFLRESRF